MKWINRPTRTPWGSGFLKIIGICASENEAQYLYANGFGIMKNGTDNFIVDVGIAPGEHTIGYELNRLHWDNTIRFEYDNYMFVDPENVTDCLKLYIDLMVDKFVKKGWKVCVNIEKQGESLPLLARAFVRACLMVNNGDKGHKVPDYGHVLGVYEKMKVRNNVLTW